MSVLKRLKKASSAQADRLFENHPLANEALDLRLQYLSAIAFASAIDRDLQDSERATFLALAKGLSIDEGDAQEQIQERASISDDDITTLFDQIKAKNFSWPYMMDLIWIQQSDGDHEADEKEALSAIADLLKIEDDFIEPLSEFVLSVRRKEFQGCIAHAGYLLNDEGLFNLLSDLPIFQEYEEVEIIYKKSENKTSSEEHLAAVFPMPKAFKSKVSKGIGVIQWVSASGDLIDKGSCCATVDGVSFGVEVPFDGVMGFVVKTDGSEVKYGDVVGYMYVANVK